MSLQNSLQVTTKNGFIDEQKLNRIISESNTRRSRFQRDRSIHQSQKEQIKLIDSQNYQDVISHQNHRTPSSIKSGNAPQGAVTANGFQTIDNMRPSFVSKKAKMKKSEQKNPINYIERNKKALENIRQKKTIDSDLMQKEQLFLSPQPKKVQPTSFSTTKIIQSKINTGMSRSKSNTSRIGRRVTVDKSQIRQNKADLTPQSRLNEDLINNVNSKMKESIISQVDQKYAELEQNLQSNLLLEPIAVQCQTEVSQFADENSLLSPISKNEYNLSQIILDQEMTLSNETLSQNIQDQQQMYKIQICSSKIIKTPSSLYKKQTISSMQKNRDKTPITKKQEQTKTKTQNDIQCSQSNINAQTELQQPQQIHINKKKQAVTQKACTPNKLQMEKSSEIQQSQKQKSSLSKKTLQLDSLEKEQQKIIAKNKQDRNSVCNSQPNYDNINDIKLSKQESDIKISIQSSPKNKNNSLFNLQSKEDFLNFSIENIWKEMEEINRSKRAAQELFSQFQSNFYDKSSSNLYDQQECSPTRRLIDMKNTATKHQTINVTEGIKDQAYQLQYITSPDKTYVIKPDEGKINYESYTSKQTDKLVQKIIEGTVEQIKFREEKSASPKKSNCCSPIKISKKRLQRASMGGEKIKKNLNNLTAVTSQNKGNYRYLDEDLNCDDEINVRTQREEQIEIDNGYQFLNKSPKSVLIEGRK